MMIRRHYWFSGRVQGVGFRYRAYYIAGSLGITGWAQVNGYRGDTSIYKRIECDLYYIENWTVLFDIKILFFTVFKGFINKNAY